MAEIKGINKVHKLYQEDLEGILDTPGIDGLSGKTFLITGATGLIGVCLIDALMRFNQGGAGISVYAVGRSKEKAAGRLGEYFDSPLFHFIEQDVRQPLPEEIVPDYIIPLASNTHPLAYSNYPIETIEINVKGAEYALMKAASCNATVLYPSSVEIYGNAVKEDVFTEDYTGKLNLANSRSCYTESKRLSEALCQSYMAEKNVRVKIVRLSRVFGPTLLASDSKASSQFLLKALDGEDVVLKSKGDQFFSYTYVADAVSAMLYVLIHGENGIPYNISSEICNVHLRDFAGICAEWAGKAVVFDLPSEQERKGFSVAMQAILENKRLQTLGWQSRYDIKNAIFRTLQILKES